MNSEERNMVRRLMSRINPIPCTYSDRKQGVYCPAYTPDNKVCCWYCDYLETCVKGWPEKQECPRYDDKRWCSAVLKAYEELKESH